MTSSTPHLLFINGDWQASAAGRYSEVHSPANGDLLGRVTEATAADVDLAIDAAEQAFASWRLTTALSRANLLLKLNQLIERDRDALAHTITREMGKPLKEAQGELNYCIDLIRFAAENARRIEGDIIPGSRSGEQILIQRLPHGVIAGIAAWNFPAALLGRKLGPALAAGNTVVLKPHELTPLTGLALAGLIKEAGFPPGVINIVTGGIEVGQRLVASPKVKLVTMTGSTAAGKKIMAAAADTLKEVRLELGGKAPFIVMEDADLDAAVEAAVKARFQNAGQICTSNERTLVHASIYDRFVEKLLARVKTLKVGDPLAADTEMGPKVSAGELEKVDAMVQRARQQGARLLTGGERLHGEAYDRGHYYAPTVLDGVTGEMDIARQEVFGPVLSLFKVKDFEHALQLANASDYGLSAYVFTNNLQYLMRLSTDLDFGEIYVNREGGEAAQGFHHGYGDSGLGGEDGKYGLDAYSRHKTVYLNAAKARD
ncbi:aldehyde dehydrogenase [Frateuria aurantia]|uniref:NAD-dependent aldehyde dehydrogenase n=1 Tax=Frateuria aurantia (strain ATCC 33424 / DSM 6220 / KCTC 2777 / LMG 1558 / NBRC 3245 / NCIMB 13370) TaxID=767434 RepID=H8L590_FRAAD|nr:aldehyde dehydrogenase [Frateuria aurantia]AFC85047.1 NAD-dependent aldehyde dehydrogenase [Frateuria aurantia DSM 6220]